MGWTSRRSDSSSMASAMSKAWSASYLSDIGGSHKLVIRLLSRAFTHGFYLPPNGTEVRAAAGRRYPLYGSNVLEYV